VWQAVDDDDTTKSLWTAVVATGCSDDGGCGGVATAGESGRSRGTGACDKGDGGVGGGVESREGYMAAAAASATAEAVGGGWDLPPQYHKHLDSGTLCNLERITVDRWEKHQMWKTATLPVVLIAPQRSPEFSQICTKSGLLERYNDTEVILSSVSGGHAFRARRGRVGERWIGSSGAIYAVEFSCVGCAAIADV
jgi:hypothetical protein